MLSSRQSSRQPSRERRRRELAIVEYVAWFNTERLHTSLGGIPPAEYETHHARR